MMDQASVLLQCPKTGQPLKIYMQRGDIGALSLPDGSIDVLLTMNGYHAFPEKEKALREMAGSQNGEAPFRAVPISRINGN